VGLFGEGGSAYRALWRSECRALLWSLFRALLWISLAKEAVHRELSCGVNIGLFCGVHIGLFCKSLLRMRHCIESSLAE